MEPLPAKPRIGSEGGGEALQHVGMLELLAHDARPTFVLDAAGSSKVRHAYSKPVYSNSALAAIHGGRLLKGIYEDDLTKCGAELSEFKSWLATEGNSAFPSFGYSWTQVVLANRWKIVFGARLEETPTHLKPTEHNGYSLTKKVSKSKAPTFDWTDEVPPLRTSAHVAWARSIAWSQTSLGPMSTWSSQLRSTANLIMQDPRPAVMFWGPELIMVYNEPYIELLGGLHPCMGASARVALAQVWAEHFEPIIDLNLAGETVEQTDTAIHMIRTDYMEVGSPVYELCSRHTLTWYLKNP
jgi:hypothetical protein